MNIKIPDRFMGQPILGAMERVLTNAPKAEPANPTPERVQVNTTIAQPEKYILLPDKTHGNYSYPDLLVPMERSHFSKNWNESHEELAKEGAYMLTLRQFVDFLNLLKSGNAYDGKGNKIGTGKSNILLNEIVQVRDPWRSEWIDAHFYKDGKKMNVAYHVISPNGTIQEIPEPLEECLMQNKTPGIDFNDWIAKATRQGMPAKKTKKGELYYWAPVDGSVARFVANSGGAYLDCGRYPTDSSSSLGVRAVRRASP